ncbi:MAG: GNAT family N-acetyltransferase [Bacteroidales bacterium]
MEEIIAPVDREKILAELTNEHLIRKSHFGSNLLFSITAHNAPNTMLEIGRLREIAFRAAGGGTGKNADIDEYDTNKKAPYNQLIVWDPEHKEIIGGYRYILCNHTRDENGTYHLATKELFEFSDEFKEHYLPYVIEMGRSFVHLEYQSGNKARKGIFALDNLWEGLGAVVKMNSHIKYLLGKVTMYLQYDKLARDYILYFLKKNFPDTKQLVKPIKPLHFHHPESDLAPVFTGKTIKEDYKILFSKVREQNVNIPPLINSYVNLSETIKIFGTALNTTFGDVEETGMLVTVNEIEPKKYERYINSYNPDEGM